MRLYELLRKISEALSKNRAFWEEVEWNKHMGYEHPVRVDI